jgi:hypothetical protein
MRARLGCDFFGQRTHGSKDELGCKLSAPRRHGRNCFGNEIAHFRKDGRFHFNELFCLFQIYARFSQGLSQACFLPFRVKERFDGSPQADRG